MASEGGQLDMDGQRSRVVDQASAWRAIVHRGLLMLANQGTTSVTSSQVQTFVEKNLDQETRSLNNVIGNAHIVSALKDLAASGIVTHVGFQFTLNAGQAGVVPPPPGNVPMSLPPPPPPFIPDNMSNNYTQQSPHAGEGQYMPTQLPPPPAMSAPPLMPTVPPSTNNVYQQPQGQAHPPHVVGHKRPGDGDAGAPPAKKMRTAIHALKDVMANRHAQVGPDPAQNTQFLRISAAAEALCNSYMGHSPAEAAFLVRMLSMANQAMIMSGPDPNSPHVQRWRLSATLAVAGKAPLDVQWEQLWEWHAATPELHTTESVTARLSVDNLVVCEHHYFGKPLSVRQGGALVQRERVDFSLSNLRSVGTRLYTDFGALCNVDPKTTLLLLAATFGLFMESGRPEGDRDAHCFHPDFLINRLFLVTCDFSALEQHGASAGHHTFINEGGAAPTGNDVGVAARFDDTKNLL